MAKLIDFRMQNNTVNVVRPDGEISFPISTVVNHTGIAIDFIRHDDGTIELRADENEQ
jgi:hypothetical protein